jgi:hypothetical protein
MALVVGNVSDNPFQPGVTAETYLPDQLIAGDMKIVTKDITVKMGGAYKRGTVMGKITLGAAASAAKAGGNTGTGTFVLDGVTPVLANAKAGVYTLRCIIAAANSGTFVLTDPKGVVVGEFIIPAGAGNNVAIANQIKGVLTDGGVDFIVGDGFDITIAAGSGKYVPAVATALDGSQVPEVLLVDDTDTTAADQNAGAYQTGEFNGNKIIYDDSFTLAQIVDALRLWQIFIKTAITAADPA